MTRKISYLILLVIVFFLMIGQKTVLTYAKAFTGDAQSQYTLGSTPKSYDVGKDDKHRIYWLTKSAEQGYAKAQVELGSLYSLRGKEVAKDGEQAIYWLTKAADQGNFIAQEFIGFRYETGDGVPKDGNQAIYWYMKSAEQGHANARNSMARMYISGEATAQDIQKGVNLYIQSAKEGNMEATFKLASLYLNGKFVPMDYKKAYVWASVTSDSRNPNVLSKAAAMLTPNEIEEAKQEAAELKLQIETKMATEK